MQIKGTNKYFMISSPWLPQMVINFHYSMQYSCWYTAYVKPWSLTRFPDLLLVEVDRLAKDPV